MPAIVDGTQANPATTCIGIEMWRALTLKIGQKKAGAAAGA